MWAPVYLPPPRSVSASLQLGQVTVTPYRGVPHSIEQMKADIEGPRGGQSMVVRRQMELICERVAPKDYLSELLAARYWVNLHVPYFRDPRNIELMRDPTALIEEIHRSPSHVVRADCDEITQLIAQGFLVRDELQRVHHVIAIAELYRTGFKEWELPII